MSIAYGSLISDFKIKYPDIYPVEIPDIFGGEHFQPPKTTLIVGYPSYILRIFLHILGHTFSQTFFMLSLVIYETSSMKHKISGCTDIKAGYERI
jgi:hypothetical protein